jgi:RNA polymerase sigma factor (TIGR02999 family)
MLLQRASAGDPGARDELARLLYGELRALAEGQMRAERDDHTLQPTALVHEAWVRLMGTPGGAAIRWQDRSQFLCFAAQAMRNVLVDHARRRKTQKRSAPAARLELDEALAAYEIRALDLLALDEALERLAQHDAELARLFELRFFGGLTGAETAVVLGLTERQVEGAWVTARGWLRRELDTRGSP